VQLSQFATSGCNAWLSAGSNLALGRSNARATLDVGGTVVATTYSNLPASTSNQAGVVQLDDTGASSSVLLAPTANALRRLSMAVGSGSSNAAFQVLQNSNAYTLAPGVAIGKSNVTPGAALDVQGAVLATSYSNLPTASTTAPGAVQLINAGGSTSLSNAPTMALVSGLIATVGAIQSSAFVPSGSNLLLQGAAHFLAVNRSNARAVLDVEGDIRANAYSNLPVASTTGAGVVQLVDSSASASVSNAPTANALKTTDALARSIVGSQFTPGGSGYVCSASTSNAFVVGGTSAPQALFDVRGSVRAAAYCNIQSASTTGSGIVQLVDDVTSASTSNAATANAVRTVWNALGSNTTSQFANLGQGTVFLPSNQNLTVGGTLTAGSFCNLPAAGTAAAGVVQLVDSFDWPASNTAPTSSAVQRLYQNVYGRPTFLNASGTSVFTYSNLALGQSNANAALDVAGDVLVSGTIVSSGGGSTTIRNRMINGSFAVQQRPGWPTSNKAWLVGYNSNVGAAFVTNSYVSDRWMLCHSTGINDGLFTATRVATDSLGARPDVLCQHPYALLIRNTRTGTGGPPTTTGLVQVVEGTNTSDLLWGTASGSPVTLSFWANSSVAGNFGVLVRQGGVGVTAAPVVFPTVFTLSTVGAWQHVSLVVPAPPTGTSWATDTSAAFSVTFTFLTNVNVIAANNAWSTWPTGSAVWGVASQVDFTSVNNATFALTGVQLERGARASAYEFRTADAELSLCRRYFESTGIPSLVCYFMSINPLGSTQNYHIASQGWKTSKRVVPLVNTWPADPNVNRGYMLCPSSTTNSVGQMAGVQAPGNFLSVDSAVLVANSGGAASGGMDVDAEFSMY
jgi:hypothetical protein